MEGTGLNFIQFATFAPKTSVMHDSKSNLTFIAFTLSDIWARVRFCGEIEKSFVSETCRRKSFRI